MPKFKTKKSLKRIFVIFLAFVLVFSSVVLTADIIKNVKLRDGQRELRLKTYSNSTEQILSLADVTLNHADEVKRRDTEELIYIEVLRAYEVPIVYHGEKTKVTLADGSVLEAIEKAGITLSKDDVVNYDTDTKIFEGIEIVVDEVKFTTETKKKEIGFETEYQESDDYPKGYEEVTREGENGFVEITTTYKYVNGESQGSCGEIENVVKKPISKLVTKGTAEVALASNLGSSTSSSGSGNAGTVAGLSYKSVLTGSATAYTASEGALTATGVPAYVGGVAVNPNIIPYGSKLYIVADGYTYGYATAVDTGGALMSGSALVDLYMSTYDECINFGRRNVTVYVLS